MLIRQCPIWLLGAVVVTLALTTSGIMAARAYVTGESASMMAALLAPADTSGADDLPRRAVPPVAAGPTAMARALPDSGNR
jgi:hypothetical protein